MAGAHSRSSSPERDESSSTSERDLNYGDVLRSRPAPISPPVGFPSAFSTGSFRSSDSPGASGPRSRSTPESGPDGSGRPGADDGRDARREPRRPGADDDGGRGARREPGRPGDGGGTTSSRAPRAAAPQTARGRLASPSVVPAPPPGGNAPSATIAPPPPARPGSSAPTGYAPVAPPPAPGAAGTGPRPPGAPGPAPGRAPGRPVAHPSNPPMPVPPPAARGASAPPASAPPAPARPAGPATPPPTGADAYRPAVPAPAGPSSGPSALATGTGLRPAAPNGPSSPGTGPRPPAPRGPSAPGDGNGPRPPAPIGPSAPNEGAGSRPPNGPSALNDGAGSRTPAPRGPSTPADGTDSRPPAPSGPPTPRDAVDGPAATKVGPSVPPLDEDDEDDDEAPRRGTDRRPADADEADDDADEERGTTALARADRLRSQRRAGQRDALSRAAGKGRTSKRGTDRRPQERTGTTPRRGTATQTTALGAGAAGPRRRRRGATETPEPPQRPRGRVALAVVTLVAAVAAKVEGWPGGTRVVAAGRWLGAKGQAYLDGKDPDKLAEPALLWRRRRRGGYALLATMIGVPVLAFGLGYLLIPIPNADEAVESQLNTISFSDGTVLARVANGEQGNREKVTIDRIPKPVQFSVLSAEDRSFYENSGFDVTGILHAAFKQVTGGSGGGSTITQQYVKNAMVGDEHSYVRKFKELIISSKITQERSKDQILEDYLNSIYFGRGAYGIQAASQAYFGKPVETLTPAEGALLAGVIQAPSKWDPAINPVESQNRWNYVMDGLVTQNWLPANERAAARFPATIPPRKVANGVPDDSRGHIFSAVKEELKSLGIDEDALVTEGLQIQTTIAPQSQNEAVEASRKEMAGEPGNLRSAVVSVDPRSGGILSYYGGDNGSGLDYAQVEKQAGSTFKPFTLLAALQQPNPIGLSTEFDGQSVPGKTVRNVDGADCANCNLKRAMTLSNNVVYTALGNKVGPQAVADAAHQAGVTAPLKNPDSGLTLGNAEVTPLEMASAYATFANDGVYYKPHLVEKVTTSSGEVLYDHAATQGEQRIDPKVARNVTEAMRDVPEYDGATLNGGRISAAKTGTVQSHVDNQNNDAWMVGYTPSAATSVWVGTDDNTPIQTADRKPIYGHGLPSEIWKAFMDVALEGSPKQTFGSFTPVAGSDPGDTASGEGQQEGAVTPSSSSAATPTTSARASTPARAATPSTSEAPAPAQEPPARAPAAAAPPAQEPAQQEAPAEQQDGGDDGPIGN